MKRTVRRTANSLTAIVRRRVRGVESGGRAFSSCRGGGGAVGLEGAGPKTCSCRHTPRAWL